MAISETTTENIFRDKYGAYTFIEKSAIPSLYGFKSKKGTNYKGYPDFFRDMTTFCVVVEAKANDQNAAEEEVKYYMKNNSIDSEIIGVAVSGQSKSSLKVTYYFKDSEGDSIFEVKDIKDNLIEFDRFEKVVRKEKYGDIITNDGLYKVLNEINKQFNDGNKIRDTERSLFFSGIMIALSNNNFKSTYKKIQAPTKQEKATTQAKILESHHLNNAILNAITSELGSKINNLSKEYSWADKFSFIKNIDYSLNEYKAIVEKIEKKIFYPFQNEEKQDILGKAYKIFLSRAGKVDNKNIILTPDHIKHLMVRLARVSVDDVVLDTCTGSGGFLMEAMETMISQSNGDEQKINDIKEKQLIGFENDSVLFALACSNMFLHGDGRTNLLYRSSLLEETENDNELFNYIKSLHPNKVIINPPYECNNSAKFTLQALKYLDKDGMLVIIMPTPTLTKNVGGLTEEILSMAKLEFVIKMPTKLFAEQKRTVNTSIFGFKKTPHQKNDKVLFYNLEDDGFVSIQHKGRVDKKNMWDFVEDSIVDAIENKNEIGDICEKRKIYNGDVLNPSGVQNRRYSKYQMVKVSQLFSVVKGTLASESNEEGEYAFVTAGDEPKTHTEYTFDTEALIYAIGAAGSLGKANYFNGKFIASNLCLVLTPKDIKKFPINLRFYQYYFQSIKKRVINDLADGTSKLTIDKTAFENYYIDYVPIDEQNEFVNTKLKDFLVLQENFKKAKEKLEKDMLNLPK